MEQSNKPPALPPVNERVLTFANNRQDGLRNCTEPSEYEIGIARAENNDAFHNQHVLKNAQHDRYGCQG